MVGTRVNGWGRSKPVNFGWFLVQLSTSKIKRTSLFIISIIIIIIIITIITIITITITITITIIIIITISITITITITITTITLQGSMTTVNDQCMVNYWYYGNGWYKG